MQSFILIGWKVSGSSILDFFVFFCFLWTSLQWFTLENLLPSYILKYRHHINRNIKGSHLIFKKVDYWVTCFTFFLKCPGRGQVKRNVLLFFKQSKTYISHWQIFLKVRWSKWSHIRLNFNWQGNHTQNSLFLLKQFLQRMLQEIMKKKITWNIRCLVDESFVPATQQTSILYWRLSDFTATF